MTTDLTEKQVNINNLVPSQEERDYYKSIPDDSFLPSVKLLQGTSPELKTPGCVAGNYFLTVRNKSLGAKVLICVCARRPHALLLVNNKKSKESFNFKSPIFQEIVNTKSTKDQIIRASWTSGDFLVWLPEEQEFASFFPGQKTLRPVALDIIDHMTPLDQRRKSETNPIYTNCFELYAEFVSHGASLRSWVPKITPLDPERKDLFPEDLPYKSAIAMFLQPVNAEASVRTATEADDR